MSVSESPITYVSYRDSDTLSLHVRICNDNAKINEMIFAKLPTFYTQVTVRNSKGSIHRVDSIYK